MWLALLASKNITDLKEALALVRRSRNAWGLSIRIANVGNIKSQDGMLDRNCTSPDFSAPSSTQLLTRFNTYFRTQEATSTELLSSALALRYQVYCLERKFENADRYADCLERDELDRHSVHGLIVYRPREEAIGAARLILPECPVTSLPVQLLLRKHDIDAANYFPVEKTAEVSRFAISREFRRRLSGDNAADFDEGARLRRGGDCFSNLPCLGLAQILVQMSLARGITHWAAMMEPKLLRMLSAMGIHFTAVGPLVSHHGIRQPAFCHVPGMLKKLLEEKPQHWDIVTDAGNLCYPEEYKILDRGLNAADLTRVRQPAIGRL